MRVRAVLRPLILNIQMLTPAVTAVVVEKCLDPALPKVAFTEFTAVAAYGRICEQVVEVVAEKWEGAIASMTLKVTDKLRFA